MSKKNGVYYCELCGNIIEELWDGKTEPQCCGQQMNYLEPNTTDAATEKHVPVIEREGTTVTVKVGEVAHPMTPDHYILFVEVLDGDNVYRKNFKVGDAVAEAVFTVSGDDISARAYCNLHGFWASK
jgi:superoxide reductase